MQAVILAGGRGIRLKPYTTVFPKPLMPIGDIPILEVVIRQLKYYGFKDVIMATGYLQELIQAFFNNGKKWGVNISYSHEDKPLGTVAPLKLIQNLQDDFLVMNGDVLTTIDFGKFFQYHKNKNGICTIAAYNYPTKISLGVLESNENDELSSYTEKPTVTHDVSMGIYAFRKEVLEYIPKNVYYDFPQLIGDLLNDQKKVMCYRFDDRWLDIGLPGDYENAVEEFNSNKSSFLK